MSYTLKIDLYTTKENADNDKVEYTASREGIKSWKFFALVRGLWEFLKYTHYRPNLKYCRLTIENENKLSSTIYYFQNYCEKWKIYKRVLIEEEKVGE